MKIGSLFAGYGGLDMGVQSVLGGKLAWYAEFDKHPAAIMAHHHPDVPNLWDVSKVDWSSVEPVDVLTGGTPCQDLSHAGKRAGMTEGTRSNLWVAMREAIAVLRPSLVVWENVRGALSAPADSALEPCPGCVGDPDDGPVLRALGRVLGDLSDLRYDTRWYGLRAADVGAPHGRFRVFLFATPADSQGDEQRKPAIAGPLRDEPRASVGGHAADGLTLLPTPVTNDMGEGKTVEHWDAWTATMQAKHGNGNGHGKSLAIEAQRLLPTPTVNDAGNVGGASQWERNSVPLSHALLPTPRASEGMSGPMRPHANDTSRLEDAVAVNLLPTPRATDGTKGGPNQRGSSGDLMLPSAVQLLPTPSVADVEGGRKHRSGDRSDELLLNGIAHHDRWGDYAPAIARWEHVLGRPAPAPTEVGAARLNRHGNPSRHPRLSPRFVEWMMGLPEGHVTDVDIPRNAQLKALGNGVVPQQAAAATRAFLADQWRVVA